MYLKIKVENMQNMQFSTDFKIAQRGRPMGQRKTVFEPLTKFQDFSYLLKIGKTEKKIICPNNDRFQNFKATETLEILQSCF